MLKSDNTSVNAITWLLNSGGLDTPKKSRFETRPMSVTHPHLVPEFDLIKNAPKTPTNTIASTGARIWWVCAKCEHQWSAVGVSRSTMGSGCPACAGYVVHSDGRNSMRNTNPELAAEFDIQKNSPRTPDNTLAGSHQKIWWLCGVCQHSWQAKGNNRLHSESGCPSCSGRVVNPTGTNSLAAMSPHLVFDFDMSKNHPNTPQSLPNGTQQRVWWICHVCSHVWGTVGNSRTLGGNGCPACPNVKIVDSQNCMATTNPEMILEFDLQANFPNTPQNTMATTVQILWWRCHTCCHTWQRSGAGRYHAKSGCPACSNSVVNNHDGRNSLAVLYPEVASEFDLLRNHPKTPKEIVPKSGVCYWWSCGTCSRSWQATGHDRCSHGSGCPYCNRFSSSYEHIFNTYVQELVGDTYQADIDPDTSIIHNPHGRDFQIDARVYQSGKLVAVFLYDGLGGHWNTEKSIARDTKRRIELCGVVPQVFVHRHGMSSLTVPCTNYHEVVTAKRSSILSGAKALVEMFTQPAQVCPSVMLDRAAHTWGVLPQSNPLKMQQSVYVERLAIAKP